MRERGRFKHRGYGKEGTRHDGLQKHMDTHDRPGTHVSRTGRRDTFPRLHGNKYN